MIRQAGRPVIEKGITALEGRGRNHPKAAYWVRHDLVNISGLLKKPGYDVAGSEAAVAASSSGRWMTNVPYFIKRIWKN